MTVTGWDGIPCGTSPIDPRSVAKIGHALLQAVKDVYADAGISLPTRQVWTAGEVAWDCELLSVSLDSLRNNEQPGWEGSNSSTFTNAPCEQPIVAVFQVSVVRCIPNPSDNGTPPSPEDVALAADMTAIDAYLLQKSACRLDFWGWDMEPPNQTGGLGVTATVEVQGPQGGMQAVMLTLTGTVG